MCDGHIVYQGDAKASAQYFKTIGKPVPRFANPADYFMKLLAIKYPKQSDDEEKIAELLNYYCKFLEGKNNAENNTVRLEAPKSFGADVINHKATNMVQLNELMKRSWTLAKRDPRLSRAKILQTMIVGILMLGCFWQVNDYSSQVSV